MLPEDLEALLPALEGFHARFGRFFRRSVRIPRVLAT